MGILNVTPDSFSDGGQFVAAEVALRRVDEMIVEGVDIIDIGGESTRPGSVRIDVETEIERVVPMIRAIRERFDVPISIDTSKAAVAQAAVDAGAEIINDISGLRWDAAVAGVAAQTGAGLVLMHSRGPFESMHSQPPVDDIFSEIARDLTHAVKVARDAGVGDDQIVLDVGIGFAKTGGQNLDLIANLDKLADEIRAFPLLIGASRKSFIGAVTGEKNASQRLGGSVAAAVVAVQKGAKIVRVHDVGATVSALRVLTQLEEIEYEKIDQ